MPSKFAGTVTNWGRATVVGVAWTRLFGFQLAGVFRNPLLLIAVSQFTSPAKRRAWIARYVLCDETLSNPSLNNKDTT